MYRKAIARKQTQVCHAMYTKPPPICHTHLSPQTRPSAIGEAILLLYRAVFLPGFIPSLAGGDSTASTRSFLNNSSPELVLLSQLGEFVVLE